jgi:hypothetical protein
MYERRVIRAFQNAGLALRRINVMACSVCARNGRAIGRSIQRLAAQCILRIRSRSDQEERAEQEK